MFGEYELKQEDLERETTKVNEKETKRSKSSKRFDIYLNSIGMFEMPKEVWEVFEQYRFTYSFIKATI